MIAGDYDLGGLLARIEFAINKVSAQRLVIDSLDGLFAELPADAAKLRSELQRVATALAAMGVTTVMTAERRPASGVSPPAAAARPIADNLVVLRNAWRDEKRRRTVEVAKFRGAPHQKGAFPFAIVPSEGIVVIPLSAIELKQRASEERVSSGNPALDKMCGGGLYRDSLVVVSGATGTGKTLMAVEFLVGGAGSGDRCLAFAFEESRAQLQRSAKGWGVDFERMEHDRRLAVVCAYPETAGLEDHFLMMRDIIDRYEPQRVVVDSLSALERIASGEAFREFVVALIALLRDRGATGLLTTGNPALLGGWATLSPHLAAAADVVALLRHVELAGEVRRAIAVLKRRGSWHETEVREYTIGGNGMRIGRLFRQAIESAAGQPADRPPEEARLDQVFPSEG